MNRVVYFDLEQTVIDDWYQGNPVNIHKVREFIKHNEIDEIRIFSFAIYSDPDIKIFNTQYKEWLELMFRVKIVGIMPEKEVTNMITEHYNVEFADIFNVLDKQFCFIEYAKHNYAKTQVVLLDDQVTNMTINDRDRKLQIDLINVNSDIGKYRL